MSTDRPLRKSSNILDWTVSRREGPYAMGLIDVEASRMMR
jgi:hypothetical protein